MLSSNTYCQHFRHLYINLSVMHKHFHFLGKLRGQHRVPRKKKDVFKLGVRGRTGGTHTTDTLLKVLRVLSSKLHITLIAMLGFTKLSP